MIILIYCTVLYENLLKPSAAIVKDHGAGLMLEGFESEGSGF